MLLETLGGSLLGGLFRLAPEAIKLFDRKSERAHELQMFKEQVDLEKTRSAGKLQEIGATNSGAIDAAAMQAFGEAIRAQAQPTGVKWVDAANAMVRPSVTYILVALYVGTKASVGLIAYQADASLQQLVDALWGVDDQALLAGILNYWFLDRTIRKRGLA
jgi:hypothetical protein